MDGIFEELHFRTGLTNFKNSYKCYPFSMMPKNDHQFAENGNKIILPQSALQMLTILNTKFPVLFKIKNGLAGKETNVGVLEFTAEEKKMYLPSWLMKNLLIKEGDFVNIESISLPKAIYAKFQPKNEEFFDITNPKAVLENALRNFACLTSGDEISIQYNQRIYILKILKLNPDNAGNIFECDLQVDFTESLEKEETKKEETKVATVPVVEKKILKRRSEDYNEGFTGVGYRLSNKKRKIGNTSLDTIKEEKEEKFLPNYNFEPGVISFNRRIIPISDRKINKEEKKDDGFTGEGRKLSNK